MKKPYKAKPVSTGKCPVCGSPEYRYSYETEYPFGVVEQHALCKCCGLVAEQCYGPVISGHMRAIRRGLRNRYNGVYLPANWRHHRRMRRKYGIKHESNDHDWMLAMI